MGLQYENLEVTRGLGVAWIRLDRPAQANALSPAMAQELHRAVLEADADPGCHAIILAGKGRFFCAGGDVVAMAAATHKEDFLFALAGAMHDAILALANSRLVTIALVHGPTAGAGLGLVLNANFVIVSPGASFTSGYSGVGLTPDCGVSYLLPRTVGPRHAAEMLLAGRSLDALTAVSWGLATKCVDASELEPSALSLASSLVGSATQMLGPTKQLLTAGTLEGYAAHLAAERASISAIVANPDTRARVSAFARRSS